MGYLNPATMVALQGHRRNCVAGSSAVALAVALFATLATGLYSSPAEARCCRHGARFASGVVVGAVLARPHYIYAAPRYYAPPVYYPAPVYYAPPGYYPPPAVAYANPPVYIEQPNYGASPAPPPAAALSIEERLRRLQAACNQGLLSAAECASKRQELLRLM